MEPEDIDVHVVTGLGIGTNPEAAAWVVFCRTRCCNRRFFEWISIMCVVPFIRSTRIANRLPEDSPSYFQLEGELEQVSVYTDDSLLATLKDCHIMIGKPPGSTTATTQPCDVGKCFLSTKAKLRAAVDVPIATHPQRKCSILM